MALSESIAERLVLKAYASSVIAATEPDPTVAPAASGGRIMRHRPGLSLSLATDYYAPDEKRPDRNRGMGRHGMRRAPAAIPGLLSPDTYADLFESALQGTWAAGLELGPSDLTSIAADADTSTFIAAAGDPVALGLRIGDIMRLADLSDAQNNARNFLITGFSGSNNRTIAVYPAPDTHTADTSFTLTTLPSLLRPTSGHVSRKWAAEVYNPDSDLSELYTEGRFGGFDISVPPNDNVSVTFNALFRNQVEYSAGSAPFFSAPSAETTTGIVSGVTGFLMIDGTAQGIVTNLSIAAAMQLSAPNVVGAAGLHPDILLGEMDVSGNFSALLSAFTLSALYRGESETGLLLYLPATSAVDAPAISVYLPRIKLNTANRSDGPELAKVQSFDFAGATYEGSAAGEPNTVLRMVDTEVTA